MKIQCAVCQDTFDPTSKEKRKAGGMFSHCPKCAREKQAPKTGAMVYSHKTAPEIQIQEGTPEGSALSAYLNKSVQGQRNSNAPVTHGAVAKVADVGQSRRGDTTVDVPRFEVPEQMAVTAGSNPATPHMTQAVWYDPSERCLFRIADGRLFTYKIQETITWVPTNADHTRIVRQKGLLSQLLTVLSSLLTTPRSK